MNDILKQLEELRQKGKCPCIKTYGHCKFVRGNRSNLQTKVRYCFIRKMGCTPKQAKVFSSWKDKRFIEYLKKLGTDISCNRKKKD